MLQIVWSNYLRYRAELRGFDLAKIEEILRFSGERYYDTVTGREIVVGKHDNRLVIIPYEHSAIACRVRSLMQSLLLHCLMMGNAPSLRLWFGGNALC
jgi:hypothetical protein